MVRSRFMAQMEQLNTELIVMGTLCENALEKVANALDNPTDEVSRDIIILSKKTEEKERELILKALEKNHGKRKLAAKDLGISERTLYRKLKEYNLEN